MWDLGHVRLCTLSPCLFPGPLWRSPKSYRLEQGSSSRHGSIKCFFLPSKWSDLLCFIAQLQIPHRALEESDFMQWSNGRARAITLCRKLWSVAGTLFEIRIIEDRSDFPPLAPHHSAIGDDHFWIRWAGKLQALPEVYFAPERALLSIGLFLLAIWVLRIDRLLHKCPRDLLG